MTHQQTGQRKLTEQAQPAYAEGFYDSQKLEPLFADASPDYAAGWRAFWECRAIITEAGRTALAEDGVKQ